MIFGRFRRRIAFLLLILMLLQASGLPAAYALTSGPSQPEVQSFEPAGTTEMVDTFTGDFTYNIPLFELPGPNGGYPFNLSYHAGIGMDQESSWVGLGWNLNPGAINRQMRGLPDEFRGDGVHTKNSVNPNVTVGLGAGVGVELFGSDALKAAIGFSVYNNNYKGVGYSIDGSLGFSAAAGSGATAGVGLGFSLDSQEGINLNPSLSLNSQNGPHSLGIGYNSRQGLKSLTHSFGGSKSYELSCFNPGFTPQVGMPFNNFNVSAEVKAGGSWWGIFGAPYLKGFYNEQRLKNDKRRIQTPAYGYFNYQYASEDNALLDFSREQDGVVRKESPNLPIPSLTYDIYSLTGQGIAAMYRPFRPDYGVVHDPKVESTSNGGSIGGDVGPALTHVGLNLGVNHSSSVSGAWTDKDDISSNVKFQTQTLDDPYEPWYFKVHGESVAQQNRTLDDLGGEAAVRVKLGTGGEPQALKILENKKGAQAAPNTNASNRERNPRGEVISHLTNAQLLKGNEELVNLFKVTYVNAAGAEQKYDRTTRPVHHTAGLTALNTDGLRYTYAIPAYNLFQEEVQFSCRKPGSAAVVANGDNGQGDPLYEFDNTDKYLNRTEMPAFAHSYLLTSIVGPDYVDVTGNGVSEDDLGYWVKFTYRQVTTNSDRFKWRAPYSKSLYNEGLKTDLRDDRGSFVYGEKEIWYLSRAETKSHITAFLTEEREDGRGVVAKLQDTDQQGKKLHALKEIRLFTRSAGTTVPLKIVKFEYDYSLCKGVPNTSANGGKLTLKKMWFEYGTSQRGKLNPYAFDYHENNPNYDINALDRWGTYKPYPAGDGLANKEFPYAEQDPARKATIDQNAAAWSLKEIRLPSGGKIKVDLESDDYAYVQHRQAMQMMPLVAPWGSAAANRYNLIDSTLKIRFPLEKPIAGTLTAGAQRAEVLKYLDTDRKQLYFKIRVNLRQVGENYHEYISGYADIDFAGAMGLETDGSSGYKYGYFRVLPEKGFHPFSLRAWQHLRVNQPDLASVGKKLKGSTSNGDRLNDIRGMASIVPQIRQMFEGFNNYCHKKGWGREIVVGKSWIRLNSPDWNKYGGGVRVKQVTLSDQWQHDEEGIYGQVYDYSLQENGKTISSGVATYEPFAGGEENALRYAKKFVQAVPLASDNNLFFEYPINEGYFPGPGVGYRKVTVKSLASASLAGETVKNTTLSDGNPLFPRGNGATFGTSGVTVHEFYTAKDFPVLVDETEKDDRPSNVFIPIPLLGTISTTRLTSTQGYSITTNDMHGKPKKTAYFRQDNAGQTEPEPISWVQYNYAQQDRVYDGKKVSSLQNAFKEEDAYTVGLASAADLSNSTVPKFTIGQENDFFLDMREHKDETWAGGVATNVDVLYIPLLFVIIPLPFPIVWPNVSKQSSQLRTVVSNKIIFKSGVLESVEAYDGGSLVKTQHLKWDKLTGRPILTRVSNNFDAPVYNLTTPAYQQYRGMGAAYQNTGMQYTLRDVQRASYKNDVFRFSVSEGVAQYLFPGDELILANRNKQGVGKGIYLGIEDGWHTVYSEDNLSDPSYSALIVRSGYRNQLKVDAGAITALQDPSGPKPTKAYSKNLRVPIPNN